jgi:hypothetical protein
MIASLAGFAFVSFASFVVNSRFAAYFLSTIQMFR